MNAEVYAVLSRLLDHALELPPGERLRWVDRLEPAYDSVRPHLRRLLDGSQSTAGAATFLDTIPKIDLTEQTHGGASGSGAATPVTVGPYTILGKLGEGGMGDVWLAERTDGLLKRPVALKLPRGAWPRAGLAERVGRERDILAALNHPNIARLYDAGLTEAGHPYLALEFVPGQRLDDYARRHQLPVRVRLLLFLQVARAVAHAHARLIVHRDLKPSNVLVTDSGDVKLLDFGIAKLLEPDSRDTSITDVSGLPLTPDYASPEQIAGESLSIASDIYSLGVLLYELLTGERPYALLGGSRRAIEDSMLAADPRRPSDVASAGLRATLRGDLDTIVMKAIRKQPEDRYETINAFAEDIERYLDGHPVLARPNRAWYRLSKFVVRNRVSVAASASVLLVALAGGMLVAWQSQVAFAEKVRAEEISEFLTTIFREASPYNGAGRALSVSEWLKHVKARVDRRFHDRPELRVELLNSVGASLLTLQDTNAAEIVLTQSAQDANRYLGSDHRETLRSRTLLTGVQRFQGRTREMRRELDRLLPLLRARADDVSEQLIVALRNRAHLELDEGRYLEGERAAREGVDLATTRYGDRHPETAAARLMLAWTYQFSRSAEQALEASERAYRLAQAIYSDEPQHPRVIEGRFLYGRALGQSGRLDEGLDVLRAAVSDAAAVFGPSSRMVGFYSVPLATFELAAGETDGAIQTSERALAIVSQHSRPASFRYAAVLQARGAAFLGARRLEDALTDLTQSVETLRVAFGPTHPVTRACAADQALALARLGRHDEAEQLLQQMLAHEPGPNVNQVWRLRHALGVTRRLRGSPAAALDLQRQALAALADEPAAALDRMRVVSEIGLNLAALGRDVEAAAALEDAVALSRRWQRGMNPDRAEALVALGRLKRAAGHSTEAAVLFQEAGRFRRTSSASARVAAKRSRT